MFGIFTGPDLCTVYVSYFSLEAAFAQLQLMSLFISWSAGHSFENVSVDIPACFFLRTVK